MCCVFSQFCDSNCFAFLLDSTIDARWKKSDSMWSFPLPDPIPGTWYDWASMRSLKGRGTAALRTLWYCQMYIRWVCPKTALPESLKIGYPKNLLILLIIHFPCQNCQLCYRFGLISTFSDTPRGWWQVVCARISQIGTTACRGLGSQGWKNTGDFMIYHHSIVIDTPSLCHDFSRTMWILIDHGDCFGFSTPFTSSWVSHGFGLNHLV